MIGVLNNSLWLSGVSWGFALVFYVLFVIGAYPAFMKAGKPGWAAVIPFVNIYFTIKLAQRPGWWLVLYFIPLVNIVIHLIVSVDVARAFGKSEIWGVVLLWLFQFIGLAFIGWWILGLGGATYAPERAHPRHHGVVRPA